jgi:hypothetical protein
MPKRKDLTGQVFGKLTALYPVGKDNYRNILWLCKCKCGNTTIAAAFRLINGDTKSCGCFSGHTHINYGFRKLDSDRRCRSKEYITYDNMKQRCYNFKHKSYFRYGGRGITICDRWMGINGFANFYKDMGPKPKGLSIERIDNNKGYSPENCKWATLKEQNNNRRHPKGTTHIFLSINGIRKSLIEWDNILEINMQMSRNRINRGWPAAWALWFPSVNMNSKLRKAVAKAKLLRGYKY